MKPRVYVETSVISYLTSRPALDVITAGHQVASAKRAISLAEIPLLDIKPPEITTLAGSLLAHGALSPNAFVDALHIAVSAVAGVDILLTWNFKHIANGATMRQIQRVCAENGFECPQLLTPLQLLGDDDVD